MARPLIISDCDEVLLHMVVPFGQWLDETQPVSFKLIGNDFSTAIRDKASGAPVPPEDIWRYLGLFFDTQMHRQTPIAGAVHAMNTLKEHADVVILTNLSDRHNSPRRQQLLDHGIDARVFTNQGPKGPALAAILEEYSPSTAVFIDDLAQHHGSAADMVPHIDRLHLCGEPSLAPHITCGFEAGHAHARIDTWDHALPWLLSRL
ncbi:HAD family hydrolase [Novosphingobium sp.]|uniref:HAD family hydrolase n=1 Tax=Novosphingobium sp. TaxID=1874826 RepID=UPI0026002E2E|nr:HAD family hydrolase [Novosphingobium sp.]